MQLDIEELNAALQSFTRSSEFAIASLGGTFSTIKNGYLNTWQWLNVMHKSSFDDMEKPKHYASDEVTLRCVLRALRGRFPKLHAHLFHADELGIIDCPEHVLGICLDKKKLPDVGRYI